jgi:hypothetical protein
MIRKTKEVGHSGSHEERVGTMKYVWGDNGPARPITQEYKDNWEKIFGKKNQEDSTENTSPQ